MELAPVMAIKQSTPEDRARRAAYMRAWNKTPEGVASLSRSKPRKAQRNKEWREDNHDEIRARERLKEATPKSHQQAATRAGRWRLRNPETYRASMAKYLATEKGVMLIWSSRTSTRLRQTEAKRGDGRIRKTPGGTITAKQLRDLWHQQNGTCVLTGQKMVIRTGKAQLNSASVDRIEAKKGYVMSNVRLITYQANAAKLHGTDADLIEFCRHVLTHLA